MQLKYKHFPKKLSNHFNHEFTALLLSMLQMHKIVWSSAVFWNKLITTAKSKSFPVIHQYCEFTQDKILFALSIKREETNKHFKDVHFATLLKKKRVSRLVVYLNGRLSFGWMEGQKLLEFDMESERWTPRRTTSTNNNNYNNISFAALFSSISSSFILSLYCCEHRFCLFFYHQQL